MRNGCLSETQPTLPGLPPLTQHDHRCVQCKKSEWGADDALYLRRDFTCAHCPDACVACEDFTGLCTTCTEGERAHASDTCGALQRTLCPDLPLLVPGWSVRLETPGTLAPLPLPASGHFLWKRSGDKGVCVKCADENW